MSTRNKELDSYINKGIKYIADNNILPGERVFINGRFAGLYLLNLTDYDQYSDKETRDILLNNGPISSIFDYTINTNRLIYMRRTVFSVDFGIVNQVLVANLTHDDLVWINI